MRKILLALACICALLFSPQTLFKVAGQDGPHKGIPSDSSLLALVTKYVHTPVTKTTASNGDVFLQRDMTGYLQSKFTAPPVPSSQQDYGHDHKDAMLRAFLNRPHPNVATLNNYFTDAAAEFKVPVGILKASAQVQSNWAQVSESIYGSWGVMGIIENEFVHQLTVAASLLKVNTQAIKNDPKTNIRAAAALLASYQKGKPATRIEDWFDALKSLTGLRDDAMKQSLALQIFDVMKTGHKSVSLWGEIITIDPVAVALSKTYTEPDKTTNVSATQRTTAVDYPIAVSNFTTCNFNSRPPGTIIKYYFVHYVATGTYQGAISWFKDCSSNVSAHYVVKNSDGEVSQVVAEGNRAWSQGVAIYNDGGIGVEHEVLATNLAMWDSEPMLNAAASLCRDVCNRRAIPKIRRVTNGDAGIYGHSDVRSTDCPNLTAARWTSFITRVNSVSITAPTLYSIVNPGTGTQLTASWKANTEPTLVGYRLYYATNDALATWGLAADETTLNNTTTSVSLTAPQFLVPPTGDVHHFKLTAVVLDPVSNQKVESSSSDIYSRSSNTNGPKVLIVDGFDRFGGSGSYAGSIHSFATSYFKSLRNQAQLQVSSVADEKVEDGTVVLSNYDIVVWFSGDESTGPPLVLSPNERAAIKAFLDNGGKLILTGSEIAYSVGRSASTNYDLSFLNNYLKSSYVNDGGDANGPFYTSATGIAGGPFEGLTIPFGIIYREDYPDAISAFGSGTAVLNYNGGTIKGGVAYKGTFGTGTTPGGVIFLSFTLETAAETSMTAFMGKALAYFNVTVVTIPTANNDAATVQTHAAKRLNVLANDFTNGVAFNPATVTIVSNPANGTVTIDNTGNVTYTSNAGFTGTDTYQYSVQNTSGNASNNATVSITVVAPVACNSIAPETEDLSPKRDVRGAWVSSVSNIDWPSSRTLSTSQQQAELINILNTLSATGINTVYLQVRPEADALYQSGIDPWSYWLTNSQGTAPSPLWDPLSFAIDEAHKRGMELHAWLNPYRAKQSTPTLAPNHVAALHPDWTFISGTLTMLNPGLPDVRTYLTQVIADIATRYDVDGIHFDDYFYPSAMGTQDNATYTTNNPTSIATIQDWRRNNVNQLIARVYDTLSVINAATNRNIIFGVSPFGIWKSGTPTGITGQSSYNDLYCDPIAWLQAGKVDYIAPQLYWKITGPQDYNALSKWWNDQGETYNRHVYPGLAAYRLVAASGDWAASEIENQIILNRDQSHEQVRGQILFSTQQIMANVKGIKTALQNNLFRTKSFAPAMPWKDAVCPNAPLNVRRDGDTLRWDAPAPATDGDLPRRYVVYKFANLAEASTNMNDGQKVYGIVYGNRIGLQPADFVSSYFLVTALDKNNNESDAGSGIVLPITGLNLSAKLSGNTVLVNWTTLTESNTKNFEVERSVDGRSFQYIATVTAAGTSTNQRSYNLQDFLPTEGTYYYRIKINDRDGKSSYSVIRSINYRYAGGDIVLGPNPFQTGINISNLQGIKRLEIIDLSGRVLVSKVLSNQLSVRLDAPYLPAGLYHLKVTKETNEFVMIKLVKL